jgi:recombination protein RecR
MINPIFQKIIQILDNFPDIGPRQAWRLFFWFIKQDKKFQEKFLNYFSILISKLNFCKHCFFPTIDEELCSICSDNKRDKKIVCLVARETDVITLENLKKFKGVYFVLGGLILPFENKEIIRERLKILNERLKEGNIKEIIVGLPFTKEAAPTKKEIEKILQLYKNNIKIKYPQKGIPSGGEIEFIDPETLQEAFGL